MSDTGPPRKEPPPSELRIGAAPRPVTRLSRRTLVVATALATALVFAALWYALGIRPLRLTSGPELYNTNAKPTEALAGMRDSYADLTRPRPQPVPQLGPPLPGDLGRPMLQQQIGTPTPATDPEEERRRREREQAAASVVFFTVSARPAGLLGVAPGQPIGTAGSVPSPDGIAAQSSAADDLSIQNGQSHKEAFLDARVDQAVYSPQHLQTPRSPYQLMAGSIIPAALITGLNSDLPGQVVAQVTEDVYDTVTGRSLLIPQGTRLIGKYDSHVAFGQERVLLIWTRLLMPDGSSIVLDNLPATDTEGYAGIKDGVDYHTWRLLKGVVLSSLLGISSELAANNGTQSNNRIIVGLRDSVNDTANQAGQRIVSKDLASQPTLTIRPGYPVRVLVNRDIVLRPYANR
ncbi:MAG TPA: TrbI/VirB10 family protein [Stellaceae bacterium]|jgi:type IV secretion system protein VirB10|nr:TrbI/VirB10 family protein [Stellaceae bacterium]